MPDVTVGEVGEVRAVMSDPDLAVSIDTGRSRYFIEFYFTFFQPSQC
jgi:hypothetical protein